MSYPHHCGYRIVDTGIEWNAEICSSWRVCLEESDFTRGVLAAGHRVGFIGSSDTHRAVPGMGGALTGVLATELTADGLFEAYQNRRLIATQGFFIDIDFRIEGRPTGSEVATDRAPSITFDISSPRNVELVELMRNGKVFWSKSFGSRSIREKLDGEVPLECDYYFLRVKLVGDPSLNTPPEKNSLAPFSRNGSYPHNLARAEGVFAWTSPIWVRGQAE